jgi:hypothetical protein
MTLQHVTVNRLGRDTMNLDSAHKGIIPSGTNMITAFTDSTIASGLFLISSPTAAGVIDVGYIGFSMPAGAVLRVGYIWFYVSQADYLASTSATLSLGFGYYLAGYSYPMRIDVSPSTPHGPTGWLQLQMNLPLSGINTAADVNNALVASIQAPSGGDFAGQFVIAEITGDILYAAVPTIGSVTPSGTVVNTLRPTIGWAFNGDGLGQNRFRVAVYSQAQYSAGGFSPFVTPSTWDSGDVVTSSQQVQVPNNLTPGTYRAYVAAAQLVPESNTIQWSSLPGGTLPYYFSAFTIAPATPPVPSAVVPANGSTISTDVPLLQATVANPTVFGTSLKIEWQLAQNNTFTTNPRVVTLGSFTSIGGTYSQAVSPAVQLSQGTWWVRARTLDSLGTYSAYTAAQSFTVSHVPATAGWSPAGQISIPYATSGVNLSWQFQDPSPVDSQSAYQVIVERDSDNSVIVDSGKVTSGNNVYTAAIPINRKDILLHWRVRVWDSDDVVGAYSSNQQFYTRDAPAITISQPGMVGSSYSGAYGGTYDAQVGSTGIMTPTYPVVWSVTATSGRTQVAYKVEVFSGESTLAPLVFDTGLTYSPAQSFDFTGTAHRFKLNQTYTIRVTVQDTSGMQNSKSVTAVAIWAPPPTPTFVANGTLAESSGAVTIDWSTIADPTFDSWPTTIGHWSILSPTPTRRRTSTTWHRPTLVCST